MSHLYPSAPSASEGQRTGAVLAGNCGQCHQPAERLWMTFRFELYCAACVDASIAEVVLDDAEDDQ